MAHLRFHTSDDSQEFFHRVRLFVASPGSCRCLTVDIHTYVFVEQIGFECSQNMVKDFNSTVWKMCAILHMTFSPGDMVVTERVRYFDDCINSYDIRVRN